MFRAYVSLFGSSLLWGLFPLYFYLTREVSALETVEWRVVLAVVSLLVVCFWRGTLHLVREYFQSPRFIAVACVTGLLIGSNWLFYIIAVYHNQTSQASMGYFITPLLNVLFGLWLFGEKMTRWQWLALALAAIGVGYQILILGIVPWLSLGVGLSFGLYSAVRKLFRVPPFAGLLMEMLVLLPFAGGALLWSQFAGTHFDYFSHPVASVALAFSGVMTVLPLLMFLYGVAHLPMSTVGFAQYIAPSVQFLIAVFVFHESFDPHRWIAFAFIWAGVAVYSFSTLTTLRN